MQLEQQVCSLDLAKRLEELGVKQESLFAWAEDDGGWHVVNDPQKWLHPVSAFTVAELLDIAPASTSMLKRTDLQTKTVPRYYVETFEHYRDQDYDENPANALAKMLIYLLENKLITL
jgi:hypothetical protein